MKFSFGTPRALTSSPSTKSSSSDNADLLPDHPQLLAGESLYRQSSVADPFRPLILSSSQLVRLNQKKMAGFLSSPAEQVLMGEGDEAQTLWTEDPDLYLASDLQTPYLDDDAGWSHAHSDVSGFDYFHPYPPSRALQYMSPTQNDLSGTHETFVNLQNREVSRDAPLTIAYETGSIAASTVPLQSSASLLLLQQQQPSQQLLHSQALVSPPLLSPAVHGGTPSRSRSPSPNTSPDLQNYGTLNADHRTWRCSYPGCHSKAVFVRPCDLRKHFHRHEKKFFCRHDGCSQSEAGARKAALATVKAQRPGEDSASGHSVGMSGGFSSKKDRARHEAKHNPGVECEWDGCERVFSRVDNMKDHFRRIHLKDKERQRSGGPPSDEEQ